MTLELKKRIVTSIFLTLLLFCVFIDNLFFTILLITISTISIFEFDNLIKKIVNKNKIQRVLFNLLSILYILFFSFFVYYLFQSLQTKIFILITLLICVFSDIGGIVFGKFFKGAKLTKISPNKTIAGCIGSLIFSFLFLILLQYVGFMPVAWELFIYVLTTSTFCQLGDIFISLLKRKAKVKDTGKILPGHGGLLDRIDGMLLAIPFGSLVFYILSI